MTLTVFEDKKNSSPKRHLPEGQFKDTYPICLSLLQPQVCSGLEKYQGCQGSPEDFINSLKTFQQSWSIPEYLPELAKIEHMLYRLKTDSQEAFGDAHGLRVNPTLRLLEVSWTNLDSFFTLEQGLPTISPEPGREILLLWRENQEGRALIKKATEEELLALKIVIEEHDLVKVAEEGHIPVGALDRILDRAVLEGLLLRPLSLIRRPTSYFLANRSLEKNFSSTNVFTLQWHITQACDLHCKHCYDRSDRSPLNWDQAIAVLDDLRLFCKSCFVRGQVSFTGGNPLLYPRFDNLYHAATERGFTTAILGNPTSKKRLQELVRIQHPAFFQVSLEGLKEHNDDIRGSGHFDRVMAFLEILRDLDIYSMVMLTLTRENMKDVLPLGELLQDKADFFTFNRLSMVGEGANLQLPSVHDYHAFLKEYLEASRRIPVMGIKDNLINILLHEEGKPPFGGCTGFGCGAAFNFLTLLPDGEVHACRKFPSYIGNIGQNTFSNLYDSEQARKYRSGTEACRSCSVRPVCGGCLASTYSHGLSVFQNRDPFCFLHPDENKHR